jgi:hypothetical protein
MKKLLFILIIFLFSCDPQNLSKNDNTNNTNNTTTNNTTTNNSNTNNATVLNNLNNTTSCDEGCEDWETCSDENLCILNTGRCRNSNDCEEWENCIPTNYCEIMDDKCIDGDDCEQWEDCNEVHDCERKIPDSCNFTYESDFPNPVVGALKLGFIPDNPENTENYVETSGAIQHDKGPLSTYKIYLKLKQKTVSVTELTMPGFNDNMPLFDRAYDWTEYPRCYETPNGPRLLFENEAYDLYKQIIETTFGTHINTSPEFRTVVGLRGAYPGTFSWNKNSPDYFNDTIVLMWVENSIKRVKEFPVNTDTGDNYYTETSSLLPNRLYRYVNGTHRGYNALAMYEWNYNWTYKTADDANANGHWDNDRNGWLNSGSTLDYIRIGSAHNIHTGERNAPLGSATVAGVSAGCQVIPGQENWAEFITHAWTGSGSIVNYYLIDVRDIDKAVWGNSPCAPNGTHECPYNINSLPYTHSGNTSTVSTSKFDKYNCSTADESGNEVVYLLKVDTHSTLSVSVDCDASVDIDIHLLAMDDNNACMERAHMDFTYNVAPGRYLIVADTFVSGGIPLEGGYTLSVSLD